MLQNPYLRALQKLFVKQRGQDVAQMAADLVPSTEASTEILSTLPRIYVSELVFRDGTKLNLKNDSIVLITGPNNSGKSTVLNVIDRTLCDRSGYPATDSLKGPIVSNIEIGAEGTVQQFKEFIEERSLRAKEQDAVLIGEYRTYSLKNVQKDFSTKFRGSAPATLFVSWMNAEARLDSVKPAPRQDWTTRTPTLPLQWLDFELDAENEVSNTFYEAFGRWLVVNRTAGEKIILHVADAEPPEFHNFREYRNWLSQLPLLQQQGDGMRSFAAAVLGLKVHPKSVVLLDEPEAFLHHPQARRLAEIISHGTARNTQIWLATHSNEIVRGLLDSSNDRIVIVRLDRLRDVMSAKVLKTDEVKALWSDPFLRTSDILSALFHEVAVICEGETDARFLRALADANATPTRLPDFEFFHVGGKDKISRVVLALKALSLPVCVVADIDILSEKEKFLSLFASLGGVRSSVEGDVEQIIRHVGQRNALITGVEVANALRDIADRVQGNANISSADRNAIAAIAREASAWTRLKVDGYRGLDSPTIVQAFNRVYEKSKAVGLLINSEGELEGLCRDAPKNPKSAWLENVLSRDLRSDPSLDDARKMLSELRTCIRQSRGNSLGTETTSP